MRVPSLRLPGRSPEGDPSDERLVGTARLDRRTKRLCGRLEPGDIAIIDHVDLDRVAADTLVGTGVPVVVNAAKSISGRYPNLGPEVLVKAGIILIDEVGEEIFDKIREGKAVAIDGGTIYSGDTVIGEGTVQTEDSVSADMEAAKEGLSVQLEAFAHQQSLAVAGGGLGEGSGLGPPGIVLRDGQRREVAEGRGVLDREEAVDAGKVVAQPCGEGEIIVAVALGRPDFENNRDHTGLPRTFCAPVGDLAPLRWRLSL